MKRIFAPFAIAGLAACFTLTGCSDETKVKESETVSTPSGTTKTETTKTVTSSGENAPANSAGQTGKDAMPPK